MTNTKTPDQTVYQGREFLGRITNLDAKPIAWAADGRRLGRFLTRAAALDAIMADHRKASATDAKAESAA